MATHTERLDDTFRRSHGVLLAPFRDGVLAYDIASETAHHLGPVAGWLISIDGPVPVGTLVEEAVIETGGEPAAVEDTVRATIQALRDRDLLDRVAPVELPVPMGSSPLPDGNRHRGLVHAVMDAGIEFRGSDPGLLDEIDRYLGLALDDRAPTHTFDVDPGTNGEIILHTADEWRFPRRANFFAQVIDVLNEYAARSHASLVLHAGGVRTPDGRIVVISGPIDAGKTTLIGALIQAGCDYLGDESIGIRSGSLHAIPYPKRMTMDGSTRAFLGLPPSEEPHAAPAEVRPDVELVHGEVGPVHTLLVTSYQPEQPLHVVHLEPERALRAVLANTLNLARSGDEGLQAACQLAEAVPVLRVIHGDARAVASMVLDGSISDTPRGQR